MISILSQKALYSTFFTTHNKKFNLILKSHIQNINKNAVLYLLVILKQKQALTLGYDKNVLH